MIKFLSIIVPIIVFSLILNTAYAVNTAIEIPGSTETTYKSQVKTNAGSWQDVDNDDPPNIDFDGNLTIHGYAFYLNETGGRTTSRATSGNITIGSTKATEQYCGNLDATGYNFECTVDVEDILPSGCNIGENCTIYIFANDTDGLEGNRSMILWMREINITDEYDNQFQVTLSDDIIVNKTITVSGYVYYKKELSADNVSIPVASASIYIKDPCEQKTYGGETWSSRRASTSSAGKFSFSYKPNCTGSNKLFELKVRSSEGIEEDITILVDINSPAPGVITNREVDLTEIEDIPKIIKDTPYSVKFERSKVKEIIITTDRRVLDIELILEELSNLTSVSEPSDVLYKYINITHTGLSNSYVTEVEIKFKIPHSWFSENNIDKDTIKLIKHSGSWRDVDTTFSYSHGDYYHYNATTTGLSIFAIVGEEKTIEPGEKTSDYLNITTYPKTLTIEQEKSKTESVVVENLNSTINQTVKLELTNLDSSWYTVTPSSAVIEIGANQTFNVTFNIPKDASMKDYIIKHNASSQYDYTTRNFTLIVNPGAEMKKTINATLNEYIKEFNLLEQEYNKTESGNTTFHTSFNSLKKNINSAISFRKSGDYKSVYDLFDDIKTGLTTTKAELDKLESGIWEITKKIIIAVVIGCGIAFLVYLFWPIPLESEGGIGIGKQFSPEDEKGRIKDKFDEQYASMSKDKFDNEYQDLKKIQKQTEQESKEG